MINLQMPETEKTSDVVDTGKVKFSIRLIIFIDC